MQDAGVRRGKWGVVEEDEEAANLSGGGGVGLGRLEAVDSRGGQPDSSGVDVRRRTEGRTSERAGTYR